MNAFILYRDSEEKTIDFYLNESRDKEAAKVFMKKYLVAFHKPHVITVDKNLTYPLAIQEAEGTNYNEVIEMWKKVVGGFLCLLFVIHFSVTAVHNTHANPLQVKYNKQLSFYIDPLFTQNWRLFAPTPMTSNNYFYVKAKLDNGNESRTTDWIDLVQYMYEKNNDNRFTPYNKLIRIPRGAYALIGEKDETVRKILNKVNEGELDEEEYEHLIENERDKLTEEKAIDLLNKFAEAHLISFFPENEIVEFKVLLVESEPVPFSKNGTENFENAEKYREFDWTKPQGIIPLF